MIANEAQLLQQWRSRESACLSTVSDVRKTMLQALMYQQVSQNFRGSRVLHQSNQLDTHHYSRSPGSNDTSLCVDIGHGFEGESLAPNLSLIHI